MKIGLEDPKYFGEFFFIWEGKGRSPLPLYRKHVAQCGIQVSPLTVFYRKDVVTNGYKLGMLAGNVEDQGLAYSKPWIACPGLNPFRRVRGHQGSIGGWNAMYALPYRPIQFDLDKWFCIMLEALFVGPCQPLQRPMRLTERGWDLSELRFAVQWLKTGKCGDELGLTAELLQHAPEEFLNTLLTLYNNVLVTGERPESWCKTLFSMLSKNKAITTCGLQTNCKHSFIIQHEGSPFRAQGNNKT